MRTKLQLKPKHMNDERAPPKWIAREPPMTPFPDCTRCGSAGALILRSGVVYCADCWRAGLEYGAWLAKRGETEE